MSNEIHEMIAELAKRGLGQKGPGYGSPESRSAALIMLAIDNLATAAQADSTSSTFIYKAIDLLKMGLTKEPTPERGEGDEKGKKTDQPTLPPSSGETDKKKEKPEAEQSEEE